MKQMRFKNEKQMHTLRESGTRLLAVMRKVAEVIEPRMSTDELDTIAEAEIKRLGGIPIFKGYGDHYGTPFPASICTSINEEVVHGIPRPERLLKDGDLIKLDMGLRFDGMVTDMARTFPVGEISQEAQRLLEVTREGLDHGISRIAVGANISDYAEAVQTYVEDNGFSVVRDLVGHGVGFELHEDPPIPNYVTKGMPKVVFQPGMSVALEPMVNAGGWQVLLTPDQWTYTTADGSLSAHFEDTVIITDKGVEVVTR